MSGPHEMSSSVLRTLFEQASEGVFIADGDGRYKDVNDAGCRMLGYARDELVGKHVDELLPPEHGERLSLVKQAQVGDVHDGEWELLHKDGSRVPVQLRAQVLEGQHWVAFVRDLSQQQRADRALQASEIKLARMIEVVPDAIIVADAAGRVVIYNAAAERIFGHTRAEILGESHERLIPPSRREQHREQVTEYLKGDRPPRPMGDGTLSVTGLRKNGEQFPAEASVASFETPEGVFLCVVLRDVTEQLQARASLRDHQSLLQSLYDGSSFMMWVMELDGEHLRLVHANAAAQQLLATIVDAEGEMRSGDPARDAFWYGRARACRASGTPLRFDYAYLAREGREAGWLGVTIAPLAQGSSARQRVSVVAEDITERKRSEDDQRLLSELSAALSRAGLLCERVLQEVVGLSVQSLADFAVLEVQSGPGTLREVAAHAGASPQLRATCAELTGAPAQALSALEQGRMLCSADAGDWRAAWAAAHSGNGERLAQLAPRSALWIPLRAHGRVLGSLTLISSGRTPDYGPRELARLGVLAERISVAVDNALMHDAAQRALAVRDEALSAAESASRAKSDFLSSMSHELRTPLNAILGFAQLLRRDRVEPLSNRHAERVERILKGGEYLLHLVDDILDLARIEAGGLTLTTEPVDVPDVLREVATTLEASALQREVRLSFPQLSADTPLIDADRTRFVQILINLGTNAIKYNKPNGSVSFLVSRPTPASLRVSVRDTGIGIPLDKQAALFQPFQRAGQEAGPIQGTGIGLVIAERLTRLLGGQIGFSSAPGQGSEFWLELPIRSERLVSRPPPVLSDPAVAAELLHGPRRVLYIEDNAENVAFMRDVFDSLGNLELLVAETGARGLALAASAGVGVVLLDLNLPDMSGYDVLAALRARAQTAQLPVIALTAAATESDRERGTHAGFFRYLTKPVQIADLEQSLLAAIHAGPGG